MSTSVLVLGLLAVLPNQSLAQGKNPRSLTAITPRYFDLSREYSSDESRVRARNGREFPGPTFCKGRYIAHYKDRSGTYFAPPEGCDAPMVLGVWVPDDPLKEGYDTWLILRKSNTYYGLLINWLDSLQAGNYVRSKFTIIGPELISEFEKHTELPSAP